MADTEPKSGFLKKIIHTFFEQDAQSNIRIRWKRLLKVLAISTLSLYVSFVTGLYFVFKYGHDYPNISYFKMYLYPFQRASYNGELGNQNIADAKKALETKDFSKAFQLLRVGVKRAPGNLEGRALLSELYLYGLRRPDLAIETLSGGIAYTGSQDEAFIENYVQLLFALHQEPKVIALAQKLLENKAFSEAFRSKIAYSEAFANAALGRHEASEAVLKAQKLLDEANGALLSIQNSWAEGDPQGASQKLEAAIKHFNEKAPFYALWSQFSSEIGNLNTAYDMAILAHLNNPTDNNLRLLVLERAQAAGKIDAIAEQEKAWLNDAKGNSESLRILAEFAARSGNPDLVVLAGSTDTDFSKYEDVYQFLKMEALLNSKHYQAALTLLDSLDLDKGEHSEPLSRYLSAHRDIASILRAVCYYGMGTPNQGAPIVKRVLQDTYQSPSTLLLFAQGLKEVNALPEAQEVLDHILQMNNPSPEALLMMIDVLAEQGNYPLLEKSLATLMEGRQLPAPVARNLYLKLGSDAFLFYPQRQAFLEKLAATARPMPQK